MERRPTTKLKTESISSARSGEPRWKLMLKLKLATPSNTWSGGRDRKSVRPSSYQGYDDLRAVGVY